MPDNPLAADLDHIVEHIQPLRENLRGARLFITGGTGFIGCWLLESFAWANERLDLGAQATVLARNREAFERKAKHLANHPAIQFQSGDVRDFEFPTGHFSHVIHAATAASAQLLQEHPDEMLDTIVRGTWRALDFSIKCGAKQFLLTSAGAVYGEDLAAIPQVAEDYVGGTNVSTPRTAYGKGKWISEKLCELYEQQFGIEVKLARCFAFVGPYLPLERHFAIGNFIRDALAGGPIKVNGDGTPYRSYLYAADLTIWLWTILVRGVSNRPYNVGSRSPLTIAETAIAINRGFLGGNAVVDIAKKPVPGQLAARYIPDTDRAESELGLCEWIQFDDAIQRTKRWYEKVKV